MNIHVLPGDALAERFAETNIDGETIVCRECLVDGDVKAENTTDFWNVRAAFIESAYGEPKENYLQTTALELQELENFEPGAEVNLWFEHELFCQTNMWFCLSLLQKSKAEIYRIAPIVETGDDFWKGFGNDAETLRRCYAQRIKFAEKDVELGANLWRAFQNSDRAELERLSQTESVCFPHLKAVCRAAVEKNSRPKEILREISKSGISDFSETFTEFSRRAGVYGFGDAQVKRILQTL